MRSTIETLKEQGHYYGAGAAAAALAFSKDYGCHYGMRSEYERAKADFARGYEEMVAFMARKEIRK